MIDFALVASDTKNIDYSLALLGPECDRGQCLWCIGRNGHKKINGKAIFKKQTPAVDANTLRIRSNPSLSGSEFNEDEECGDGSVGMFIAGYRVGKNQEVERYSEAVEDAQA
ncbi:hypothetical protein RUND412_002902 [Rhizina undulata]